jgi:hypothetical protein
VVSGCLAVESFGGVIPPVGAVATRAVATTGRCVADTGDDPSDAVGRQQHDHEQQHTDDGVEPLGREQTLLDEATEIAEDRDVA